MQPISALPRALRPGLVALLLALPAAGCDDAAEEPTALLLAGETHSALEVDVALPSLPELVGRAGAQGELSGAMDLWLSSWDAPPDEARELRNRAYERGADRVAELLGPDGVAAELDRLGEAVEATRELGDAGVPDDVRRRVADATALHHRAGDLLERGRTGEALEAVLRGADALRSVGPESVARTLIRRATERMATLEADGEVDEVDMVRAGRLLRGARYALEDRHWSRAIRRAYYACQIVGVDPR